MMGREGGRVELYKAHRKGGWGWGWRGGGGWEGGMGGVCGWWVVGLTVAMASFVGNPSESVSTTVCQRRSINDHIYQRHYCISGADGGGAGALPIPTEVPMLITDSSPSAAAGDYSYVVDIFAARSAYLRQSIATFATLFMRTIAVTAVHDKTLHGAMARSSCG